MHIFSMKAVIAVLVVVALGAGAFWFFRGEKAAPYEFVAAKKADLVAEVSVTGRVVPAESVDLAFEKGGKVAQAHVRVGQRVAQGTVLVELEKSELSLDLADADAALAVARAKLDEMQKGTRQEELVIVETKAANAKTALADTKANLANVRVKAGADLKDDYDAGLTAAVKASSVGVNALLVLTDLQNSRFSGYDQQSAQVADAKAVAVMSLLGAPGAGRAPRDYLSQLSGGAKGSVLGAQANASYENVDKALADLKAALTLTKAALDAVPVLSSFSSTEATNLNTEKNNVAGELSTIAAKQQAIEVQRASNQSAVASAEAAVNDASNALAVAEAELKLKEAGYTPEQITQQEASVRQAEARADVVRTQIDNTELKSPIAGVVTKQSAKVGEIVSVNTPVVSLISDAQFEIEANVPEADIARVKVGDGAEVTLDAYGNDIFFKAAVSEVDPAEIVIEGVPTYKVTLQFADKDDRVKSGMTANVDIETDKRMGVIVVPQRAIFVQNGKKAVRVAGSDGAVRETEVETGLRGSDGNIEIVKGINEGEKVVTFVRTP